MPYRLWKQHSQLWNHYSYCVQKQKDYLLNHQQYNNCIHWNFAGPSSRNRFLITVNSIGTLTVFYVHDFSPSVFVSQITYTQLIWKPRTTSCFAMTLVKWHLRWWKFLSALYLWAAKQNSRCIVNNVSVNMTFIVGTDWWNYK